MVLHTGADFVLNHAPEFVLECLSRQISLAKQIHKTNKVFVCSVEERLDAGYYAFESARSVNSALRQLCEAYGAHFIDLRPSLAECRFQGINKSGICYTFEASELLSGVIVKATQDFLE